jgi:glutathione synthase/RimK-type ligase-like ATP-grasp enzyme
MLSESHPYIRMGFRFLALPYCYIGLVNSEQCPVSKRKIFQDLIYIFFRLKYFPYNYSSCRFWEKSRDQWSFYYGSLYDPFQRWLLRKEVHLRKFTNIYQDKNECYSLCKTCGLPVPRQFCVISTDEDYKKKLAKIFDSEMVEQVIVKPIDGGGGHGIVLLTKENGTLYVRKKGSRLPLKSWQLKYPSVVQEYIRQHEKLSQFSRSTNTVRIVTLLQKSGEVLIVGALIRFGVGDAFLDNTSQGGVSVGINVEDGSLKEIGQDSDCRQYRVHPTSLIEFKAFVIPKWSEVVALAKEVQTKLSYCKLLGQDIAVTDKGPMLIEINEAYDNVGLERAYGPILKNKKVWSAFKSYGLLVNEFQKNLY